MAPGSEFSLRVATYNIHRCIGADGRGAPDRIAAVIKHIAPDIIALQEVVSTQDGDGGMLGYLAKQTGLVATPGLTMLEAGGHYGNALLSTVAPERVERFDISVAGREPRGILFAEFVVAGRRLSVFATHLGLTKGERRFQIRRLLEHLMAAGENPCVVMGDCNEWNPLSGNMRLLKSSLGTSENHLTFPVKFPIFPLDRIWVTPPWAIERIEAVKDRLTRTASDHLPLVVDFHLKTPEVS